MRRAGGGSVPDERQDVTAWTRASLARALSLPGVWRVGLARTEGGGRRQQFIASERDLTSDDAWCHIDAYDDLPLNTVVRTGTPVHGSTAELAVRYPVFAGRQRGTPTEALAAVPLVAAGQVLGGVVLYYDGPQAFDEPQLRQLVQLSRRLAAGLRRAQRSEDRPHVALADEPAPVGARLATHVVPPDLAAVAPARGFLRSTLHGWAIPQESTDTAVLCLSELVTNAVVHTHAGCGIRVVLDRHVLTTTVRDGGVSAPGAPEPVADPLQVHGRGLQLVEQLTARWGSELDAVGASVWFVLEV